MNFCYKCGETLGPNEKFCHACGWAVDSKTVNESKQKMNICPNCGSVISAFQLKCPACGVEIRGIENQSVIQNLTNMLDKIDNNPESVDRKVDLIRNFAIPNTREDLLEFIVFAASNINVNNYDSFMFNSNKATKEELKLSDAWMVKLEQAYNKAQICFENTDELQKILDIYENKKDQIEYIKKRGAKLNFAVYLITCLTVAIVLLGMVMMVMIDNLQEKNKAVENGYVCIRESSDDYKGQNYELVIKKLESLGFTNIETIDLNDANFLNKENAIKSISVNEEDSFNDHDYFDPDSLIIITYH